MPLKTSLYRKSGSAQWPRKQQKGRVLSVNMISLPLGDFRHLSHIGTHAHRDSFGDLSFLKRGHSLFLQSSQSEQNLFLACSLPPKPPRLNLDETDPPASPAWDRAALSSERRKKCSSLPLLDSEDGDEPPPGEGSSSTGRHSFCSGRDTESMQTASEEPPAEEDDDDCAFTLNLDLGPSILDDVLQVMEKLHQ
ncbi:cdc42 effector protein 3-like [Megalops cyprinoides]|uniref:cdc42 effector protein 3-like n=1 Tax=Megalops cyprinoides TaxID=118141 RepID=UPI0018656912|nr:cdc42 effector protein 3-like [Megalops cyprinoides]XP_036397417.1 cdc42 effector protein 3-like [Megalops cyprinoides]XP_036397418.1 cdc42 effector protein 3-like [Megalops cyprinoides]